MQLEKLACEHRQAEASWEARLSRASESHARALSARDRDIRILRQQYDEAMQLAEHCKADLCAQVRVAGPLLGTSCPSTMNLG